MGSALRVDRDDLTVWLQVGWRVAGRGSWAWEGPAGNFGPVHGRRAPVKVVGACAGGHTCPAEASKGRCDMHR